MLFSSDEYLLLSRSGHVPLSRTRPSRPPAPVPCEPVRGASRGRGAIAERISAIRAVRGALRATWTAFGPGSAEL